jgi:hypothetical protein
MFQVQIQTPSEWRTISSFENIQDAYEKADELQKKSPLKADFARVVGPRSATYYVSECPKQVLIHGIRIK